MRLAAVVVGDQVVIVLPAHDQVTGTGPRTVRQGHLRRPVNHAQVHKVITDLARQLPAVLPGVGHKQGVLTGQAASDVRPPGLAEQLRPLGAGDPAVDQVLLQRGLVTHAQPQRCIPLPRGLEPHRHRELREAKPGSHQRHRSPGPRRGELLVVAGHQHLATPALGDRDDGRRVLVRHHRALVDDDQRPLGDRELALGEPGQELRAVVAGLDPGPCQHVARCLAARDPEHVATHRLPSLRPGRHRVRLARPCRAHRHRCPAAGRDRLIQHRGLVEAEAGLRGLRGCVV